MKTFIIILGTLILIGGGYFAYTKLGPTTYVAPSKTDTEFNENTVPPTATTTEENTPSEPDTVSPVEVIGTSVGGRDITAYHYGQGDTELLFIGGIHGGYSWNTALVAHELMDYLKGNGGETIPKNVRVTVIPTLNPDGLESVTGTEGDFKASDITATAAQRETARFNEHDVDLNRNFDCEWKATGTWQNKTVSGGTAPFSEPESQAIRDYVNQHNPAAVVVWYSAAGGVYASHCGEAVSGQTKELTELYASASGYAPHQSFDFYEVTGDMVNWLAKEGIPAISVLLTNHTDTEWTKNQRGIEAMFKHYAE